LKISTVIGSYASGLLRRNLEQINRCTLPVEQAVNSTDQNLLAFLAIERLFE
jgi:hypothetical protein